MFEVTGANYPFNVVNDNIRFVFKTNGYNQPLVEVHDPFYFRFLGLGLALDYEKKAPDKPIGQCMSVFVRLYLDQLKMTSGNSFG